MIGCCACVEAHYVITLLLLSIAMLVDGTAPENALFVSSFFICTCRRIVLLLGLKSRDEAAIFFIQVKDRQN